MVNLKRIMAGIIAGATVVSMAACSNSTTDSNQLCPVRILQSV